jgi:phage-related protein
VLLHIFAKKSRGTPQREIDAAQRRLRDYLEE